MLDDILRVIHPIAAYSLVGAAGGRLCAESFRRIAVALPERLYRICRPDAYRELAELRAAYGGVEQQSSPWYNDGEHIGTKTAELRKLQERYTSETSDGQNESTDSQWEPSPELEQLLLEGPRDETSAGAAVYEEVKALTERPLLCAGEREDAGRALDVLGYEICGRLWEPVSNSDAAALCTMGDVGGVGHLDYACQQRDDWHERVTANTGDIGAVAIAFGSYLCSFLWVPELQASMASPDETALLGALGCAALGSLPGNIVGHKHLRSLARVSGAFAGACAYTALYLLS